MTSAESVATFQLWLFGNRALRREAAAAAMCGRQADASLFSLGQGHANLSEAVLQVKPRWGSAEYCPYFLCDQRELNYLGEEGTGQIRSSGRTAPEKNVDGEQQLQSACDVQLPAVQGSGRRAASTLDCVFWARFSSAPS